MVGVAIEVFEVGVLIAVSDRCAGRKGVCERAANGRLDNGAVRIVGHVKLPELNVDITFYAIK